MSADPKLRIATALAAPCLLWLLCLALAPRAIERDLARKVSSELASAGLGHLAHEVSGRDVVLEVPLTLPGGVDTLRQRVAALPGVRRVRMRAIGTPEVQNASAPLSVQDEIRALKGER